MHPMDDLFKSIKNPPLGSLRERRRDRRKARFIEANFLVENRWHKGAIRNISDGGAYILSSGAERFVPGEDIFLVAQIKGLYGGVRAKIVTCPPKTGPDFVIVSWHNLGHE